MREAAAHPSVSTSEAALGLAVVPPGKPPFLHQWQRGEGQDLVLFAFPHKKPLGTDKFDLLCLGAKEEQAGFLSGAGTVAWVSRDTRGFPPAPFFVPPASYLWKGRKYSHKSNNFSA